MAYFIIREMKIVLIFERTLFYRNMLIIIFRHYMQIAEIVYGSEF
jgi:hypothetical protein